MVPFDWYRSFVAVQRAGTVTGAAAALGLTQPAVTQHLAGLEAVLGDSLFTRTPRKMILTDRGAELYTQVAPAVEVLERAGKPMATPVALVRLGTPRELFASQLLPTLPVTSSNWRVHFGSARQLLEALTRGELDVVVATERLLLRGIEYRRLLDEEFILVGPASLDRSAVEQATAAASVDASTVARWLLTQRWVSYGADLPIIRRYWRQCFGQRPMLQPTLVIPDLLVLAQAIVAGHGISVLPRYLCAPLLESGALDVLWTPPTPVTNEIWLAWRAVDRERVARTVDMVAGLNLSGVRLNRGTAEP